jgi:uncharacterized membrane protein YobD (UPF0266 family)
MAKAQQIRRRGKKKVEAVAPAELPQKQNYAIILAGIIVILFGNIVMSMGDATSPLAVTISPIILFIGYCIIIPIGILYRKKKANSEQPIS